MLTVYMVTSLADTIDPGDGVLTLREAVQAAYINYPVTDTIEFDSTLFSDGPKTITLTGGQFDLIDSTIIKGPGANLLTIDAAGRNTVFYVGYSSSVVVDISGLTITGGSATSGGAIRNNSGHTTVSDSILLGNDAQKGAGIYNSGGTLNVINSIIVGNDSSSNGGGIWLSGGGTLNVVNSTVVGNTADGAGGGIYILNPARQSSKTPLSRSIRLRPVIISRGHSIRPAPTM